MISGIIVSPKLLLRKSNIVFIVFIIHGVASIGAYDYDSSIPSEDSGEDDIYLSERFDEIIKETKKILMSKDKDKRSKLKIDPLFRRIYLKGLNRQGNVVKLNQKKRSKCAALKFKSTYKRLVDIHGNDQWIINGKYFEQETYEVVCAEEGSSCGAQLTAYGYERRCEQLYTSMPLISIPYGEELTPENQRVSTYSLRSECECKEIEVS